MKKGQKKKLVGVMAKTGQAVYRMSDGSLKVSKKIVSMRFSAPNQVKK